MVRGLIYLALLIAFVILSCVKGGQDERRVAIALLFASFASLAAVIVERQYFDGPNLSMLFVDTLFLCYLLSISLRSEKYWPLWVSALQLLNATIHLVILLIPNTVPQAYAFSQGVWSYFQIAVVSSSIMAKNYLGFRNRSVS